MQPWRSLTWSRHRRQNSAPAKASELTIKRLRLIEPILLSQFLRLIFRLGRFNVISGLKMEPESPAWYLRPLQAEGPCQQ